MPIMQAVTTGHRKDASASRARGPRLADRTTPTPPTPARAPDPGRTAPGPTPALTTGRAARGRSVSGPTPGATRSELECLR
jgi:hypothetical protein